MYSARLYIVYFMPPAYPLHTPGIPYGITRAYPSGAYQRPTQGIPGIPMAHPRHTHGIPGIPMAYQRHTHGTPGMPTAYQRYATKTKYSKKHSPFSPQVTKGEGMVRELLKCRFELFKLAVGKNTNSWI